MKFVPDNYYKTRSGSRARFIGNKIFDDSNYPCVFEINGYGVQIYTSNGRFTIFGELNDLDIISEWGDEKKYNKLDDINDGVKKYYDFNEYSKVKEVALLQGFNWASNCALELKLNELIEVVNFLVKKDLENCYREAGEENAD